MGLGRGVLSRNGAAFDRRGVRKRFGKRGRSSSPRCLWREVPSVIADQGANSIPTTFSASTRTYLRQRAHKIADRADCDLNELRSPTHRDASQSWRTHLNSLSYFFHRALPWYPTLEPPRRSCFLVGGNDCAILFRVFASGIARLNYIEWSIGGADTFYERDKIANLRWCQRSFDIARNRKDAVETGGAPKRRLARPSTSDPDRNPRLLHRRRQKLRIANRDSAFPRMRTSRRSRVRAGPRVLHPASPLAFWGP